MSEILGCLGHWRAQVVDAANFGGKPSATSSSLVASPRLLASWSTSLASPRLSSSLLASPRLFQWVCLVTWASQCETAHQELNGPEFVSLHRVGALLEELKVSEILGCLCHWRAQVVEAATTCKQISLAVGCQGASCWVTV